jgi:MFS family permease
MNDGQPSMRAFWTGRIASYTGSELTLFFIPLYAAVALHADAQQMGLLVAAGTMPALLGPLYAGPLVDAVDRRVLCASMDLARGCALTVGFLFAVGGALEFGLLAGISLVLGAADVVFDSALFAVFPSIFRSERRLVAANGRNESLRSAAQLLGPGAAGGVIRLGGAPVLLLSDALSFFFSAWTIRRTVPEETVRRSAVAGTSYWASLRHGLATLRGLPVVLITGLASGGFNLFAGLSDAVFLLYTIRFLHIDPLTIGLLASASSVTGILAGVVTAQLLERVGIRSVVLVGLLLASLGDLTVAVLGSSSVAGLSAIFAAQLAASFGVTLFIVANATLRQALVPASVRGRVFTTLRVLTRGSVPIGAVLGGSLAEHTSAHTALLAAGAGQVAVACTLMLFRATVPTRIPAPSPTHPEAVGLR